MSRYYPSISDAIHWSNSRLLTFGAEVDAGHWQGVPTEGKPDLMTLELLGVQWIAPMPLDVEYLALVTGANLPWAELEHRERVSGEPHNPHESLTEWPWWNDQIETPFTHTYSERFWPQMEGEEHEPLRWGIRYPYGDLDDVVNLLAREPYTRQAYLPIFFPEDTGAMHGGRIPCTLGYHLMRREDRLHLWYDIRSCDAVRHYRDDVYLAVRLVHWMLASLSEADEWSDVVPGELHFSAHSLHVHAADRHLLEKEMV